MIGELPSEETTQALHEFFGETFVIRHLHPWRVRFRRTYAQKSLSLPSALQIRTLSGGLYKLHVSDVQKRFIHMSERERQARETGLFPKILWQNDEALLLEYLPGRKPIFSSMEFAMALGEALARLHEINAKNCEMQRVDFGVRRDIAFLLENGAIKNPHLYEDSLELAKTDGIRSSMDYADVKPGNFLWDEQGRLRFIDLGALRANRPSGQYLCGSFYFRRLNRKAFVDRYLAAGGMSQVIEQARYLRMLNCLWTAALYMRKMQEVPSYLPLHKFNYRFLAGYLLREFRELSRLENTNFLFL